MDATALVSGGKDSLYSAYLADCQGMAVRELLVLLPEDPDSMLFHTPNLGMVALQAAAWGKAHRAVSVRGSTEAEETGALRTALAGGHGPVVSGAIGSSFQWMRLQRTTFEAGRPLYAPLWGKDPERVVREEIDAGLDIRLVHLAAEPLSAELAGRRLDAVLLDELKRRSREMRSVNLAGEGGEYETLVVDMPAWTQRLVLDEMETRTTGGSTRLTARRAHLEPKSSTVRPGGAGQR
jgi:diphthine-ammonia ligase